MRGAKAAIVALVIFLIPGLIILLLRTGKNHYKRLPKYGAYEVNSQGDTTWHQIPYFSLIDQDNRPFVSDSLRGWVHVGCYFFTRCPGICPRISEAMRRLQEHFAGSSIRIRFVSYTVDPSHDTPSVLKEYASRYQANLSRWFFVTGPESTLYRLATKGYLIPVDKSADTTKGEFGYVHSDMLVLVDPELRVRGFYSALDSLQVRKLIDDINLLLLEYPSLSARAS
ncbi:MAG: SCO family protein [Bacteroidia bacterium]|nr:SCO family protein [Bacteroidia bacterium]MDW8133811.1 SCO family protein [Bacteroidia bacterium]